MADTGQTTPGIISWGALVIYGAGNVFARIVAMASFIGAQLLTLLNWAPIIIVALILSVFAFGWQNYHDPIMESGEYGMRCVIHPTWADTVSPVYTLAQRIYNPLICWWNAANWLTFGLWREVIFPLSISCGIQDVFTNAAQLIYVFADTFVADYFATGNFLTLTYGVYDWQALGDAWVTFWKSWQNLFCCFCGDMCKFLRLQPLIVILPVGIVPNPIALFGSNQIGDIQFFCFLGNLFNAGMNVIQQLFAILVYIIALVTNPNPGEFPRPDFRLTADLLCASVSCLMRSIETAAQFFVECYLPFPFNFIEFFCIIDVAACIIFKTIALLVRIFMHIDKVVFHPTDTFYETVIKVDMREVLNLYAPLRFPPWQMSTTDPSSPIYGRKRLTECLCIFMERLLCDPSAEGTACFDMGAQEIIGDFDFCCFFAEAITTIVDFVAGLGEFTYHLYSSEAFFRFVDEGSYLALDTIKTDLVAIVDCLGKALEIIPVVGWCLRNLLTVTANILGCSIVYLVKLAISILSVGFFAGTLMEENWLTTPGRALGEFETILRMIVPRPENTALENSATLSNAICCVLNRILIPPLPCTNCVPGGWLAEDGSHVKKANWGRSIGIIPALDKNWENNSVTSKLTPPIHYNNESQSGMLGFNPMHIKTLVKNSLMERRRLGLQDITLLNGDINKFVGEKKDEITNKFMSRPNKNSNLDTGSRAATLADWSFRYQTAMRNKLNASVLDDFKPRGVTQIRRYDTGFSDTHLNKDGIMVGLNARTGYIEEVDERIFCAPTPTCFNLCCIFRNTLIAGTELLFLVSRFMNGLIHGNSDEYVYFRGEGFETDLRTTITSIINILQCACDFIELVFPIPNLDLCCPFIKAGELINGILGVIINGIKSLALDPTFSYFTNGLFEADIDELFNITLEVVVCLCDVLRAILPIPGVDPCCVSQIGLFVIIEGLRFVLQLVVNLSTIETTGLDYFQNPNLDEVGMIKQLDLMLNLLFGTPGGQCSRYYQNGFHGGTGNGGIVSCFCEVINLVIPARPCPDLPVGDNNCPGAGNCPYIDLCCIFREAGFVISSLAKFFFRLVASFWQPWVSGQPKAFMDFLFCDENARQYIPTGGPYYAHNPLYKPSCGKLEPTLMAIRNLVADCPCALFRYIDVILPGPGCFCGLNTGIFQAVPDFAVEVIRQFIRLFRNFWSPSYWNPYQPACGLGVGPGVRQCSWALSFFGPISDKMCTALTSFTCFLDNLLMIPCKETRKNLVGGLVAWGFEIVIRLIEIIEGIADVFANSCNPTVGSVGGLPGTNTACLAGAIEGLFALPIDILFADGLLPFGANSQLDRLLNALPTCGGHRLSGIVLNLARYLECTFFNLGDFGFGFGMAMHGFVIFISIIWQIMRKLIFIAAAFINLITSLFRLFSGETCSCWGPERYQQGGGFAIGFCYRCLVDPCTDCGDPNGHGNCHGIPCCRSTEPAEPKVLCSFLGVITSFFELIGAFFGVFDPAPVIPPTVTAKNVNVTSAPTDPAEEKKKKTEEKKLNVPPKSRHRDTRFHERAEDYVTGKTPGNSTDIIELVFEGIVGFDVSDCPTDPVKCLCRNYPTHMEGVCTWDYVNQAPSSEKLDRSNVTPDDAMRGIAKMFNGTSPCDWFVRKCADHGWDHMSDTDKYTWTECIDKHTIGSRIHDVAPVFPTDFFTRQDGILQLIHNFKTSAGNLGRREKAKWENSKNTEQEKQRDRNNGKTDNELFRDHYQRTTEFLKTEKYRNPAIEGVIARLDLMEYKLRSGMLGKKFKRAYWNIASGDYEHNIYPALKLQKDAILDFGVFLIDTPWRSGIVEGLRIAGKVFTKTQDNVRRFGEYISVNGIWAANPVTHYFAAREKWIKKQDPHREDFKLHRRNITEAFYEGPVYKWWNSPWNTMKNPMRPFLDHVQRITRISRRPVKYGETKTSTVNGRMGLTSMLNLDQRLSTVKNAFIKRWTPRWTPEIEAEWNKALGVFYRMYNYVWPGTLHSSVQEKFIFNCNCTVADKSLDLIVDVVDYCLNDFMFNLPPGKRAGSSLERYLNQTSHKRKGFMRSRDAEWDHRSNSTIEWKLTNPKDPNSWMRPKITHATPYKKRNFSAIPKHHWQRAVTFSTATFNLYTRFFCWLEDLFGMSYSQEIAQFFLDFRDWVLNDNLNPDECPDNVGLLYWFTFFFRCEFPEYLNGSNPCAVGLKKALKYTFVISLIVFVGFSLLIPALLLPLTIFGGFIFYIIVVPAAAWHYSPQCWLIFPGIPIPGLGITIPILPFPIGFPVLPERLLDDIKGVLDDLFGPCPFENFRGIVPLCLYNGNPCPACPEKIDLANCVNVGIADGVSNLVYFFHMIWPEGLDFIVSVLGQTCFLGGCFVSFINLDYIANIRTELLTAGETQQCRQNWCAWATIISVPLPLVVMAIVGKVAFIIAGQLFGFFWDVLFLGGVLLIPVTTGDSSQYGFTTGRYYDDINAESDYQSPVGYEMDSDEDDIGPDGKRRRRRKRKKKKEVRRRRRRIIGEQMQPTFNSSYGISNAVDATIDIDVNERSRNRSDAMRQWIKRRDKLRNVTFTAVVSEIVGPYWRSFVKTIRSKDKID